MPLKSLRFTEAAVRGIPRDADQQEYRDEDVRSLRIIAGKTKHTYAVAMSYRGRRKHVSIGEVGLLPLKDARAKAMEMAAAFKTTGTLPDEDRDEWTFGRAMEAYEAKMRKEGRLEKTIKENRRIADLYLCDLYDVPLRSITTEWLEKRHAAVTDRAPLPRGVGRRQHARQSDKEGKTPKAANDVLKTFKAAYNVALARSKAPTPNPGNAVTLNKPPRTRRPQSGAEDYARYWAAMQGVKNPIRSGLYKLLLLTGWRIDSMCEARWGDIDLERRVWTFDRSKRDVEHRIPLSDQMLEVLATLPRTPSGWVFWAARSASGHVEEAKDPSLPFRPQDLRRLYRTAALAARAHPDHVRLLMHHQVNEQSFTYVSEGWRHLAEDQQRISDWIASACAS